MAGSLAAGGEGLKRRWLRRLLRTVAACAVAAVLLVVVAATPAGAALLFHALEQLGTSGGTAGAQPQAVVLLGGRTARVHHAAAVHAESRLPMLVTGMGTGDSPFPAESQKMADILAKEYGVRPDWLEVRSLNTRENAIFSWCTLRGTGVRRVLLITDARHMLRARLAFNAVGFQVVPSVPGDGWGLRDPLELPHFSPDDRAWTVSQATFKEFAGAAVAVLEWAFGAQPGCEMPPDAAATP